MPRRPWRERVTDMVLAVERIQAYSADLDFDSFSRDQKTIDAVVRNLEVLGEAASFVPEEVQAKHDGVPWREMRSMRNLLSHAYFTVDVEVVWKTVRDDLPGLLPPLHKLLGDDE